MEKPFQVIVIGAPTPDAEERLRRVFDILLRPIFNGEEDPHPVQPDQLQPATDHPRDVAANLPTPPLLTTAKNELT